MNFSLEPSLKTRSHLALTLLMGPKVWRANKPWRTLRLKAKSKQTNYSRGGGTISRVDLILGKGASVISEVVESETVEENWFVAIRAIMLSVLPNPISSARRPP